MPKRTNIPAEIIPSKYMEVTINRTELLDMTGGQILIPECPIGHVTNIDRLMVTLDPDGTQFAGASGTLHVGSYPAVTFFYSFVGSYMTSATKKTWLGNKYDSTVNGDFEPDNLNGAIVAFTANAYTGGGANAYLKFQVWYTQIRL